MLLFHASRHFQAISIILCFHCLFRFSHWSFNDQTRERINSADKNCPLHELLLFIYFTQFYGFLAQNSVAIVVRNNNKAQLVMKSYDAILKQNICCSLEFIVIVVSNCWRWSVRNLCSRHAEDEIKIWQKSQTNLSRTSVVNAAQLGFLSPALPAWRIFSATKPNSNETRNEAISGSLLVFFKTHPWSISSRKRCPTSWRILKT